MLTKEQQIIVRNLNLALTMREKNCYQQSIKFDLTRIFLLFGDKIVASGVEPRIITVLF